MEMKRSGVLCAASFDTREMGKRGVYGALLRRVENSAGEAAQKLEMYKSSSGKGGAYDALFHIFMVTFAVKTCIMNAIHREEECYQRCAS